MAEFGLDGGQLGTRFRVPCDPAGRHAMKTFGKAFS
jgi:hypothetical protein